MARLCHLLVTLMACIFAFSHVSSAYKTIVTTTTIQDNGFPPVYDGLPTTANGGRPMSPWDSLPTGEDNPRGSQEQCRSQIEEQQLDHCQMHLITQEQQHLQQCCQQLNQLTEQCQCEAIQNVVQQVTQWQKQQQQQGGRRGGAGSGRQQQQIQQILRKAQMLPNQCNLPVQQCPIRVPY